MARSMTGFGEARGQIEGSDYACEIRAVNGRYFKASIRLPDMWGFLESDIEGQLRKRLYRGSIQLTLKMKTASADAAYEVNTAAIERYIDQLEIVRPEQVDIALTVDLGSMLQLPGVCNPPESTELIEKSVDDVKSLIGDAISGLVAMREAEGQAATADLLGRCDTIQAHLDRIAQRADEVINEYHKRLKRRVEELTAEAKLKLDEQDLAREVAVFAERCDIAEEISRLTGHIEQFRGVIESDEQPGRKLEFIAQEMLREANTIASKSNNGDTVRDVVEIKTAVDRIKEQTQNLV